MIRIGLRTPVALATGPFRVVSTLELDWFLNKNPQAHWIPGTEDEFVCTGPVRESAMLIEGQAWYGRTAPALVVAPDVQFITHDGKPISAKNLYVGVRLRGRFGDFSVTRKKKVEENLYSVNVAQVGWLDVITGEGE